MTPRIHQSDGSGLSLNLVVGVRDVELLDLRCRLPWSSIIIGVGASGIAGIGLTWLNEPSAVVVPLLVFTPGDGELIPASAACAKEKVEPPVDDTVPRAH